MKSRIIRTIRIFRLHLRKVNWLSVYGFSALWSVAAFYLYADYLNADQSRGLFQLFSPSAMSLLHAVVYELSFGLPIMFTIAFLQHPLCEEYYYTRVQGRSCVTWAKILAITGITGASIFSMTGTSAVLWFWRFHNFGFSGVLSFCTELAFQLILRIDLVLFFLLSKLLGWDVLMELPVLTGIIVGGVFLPTRQVFLTDGRIEIGAFGLSAVFVLLILYMDSKRDISMEEGYEKDDR